LTKNYGQYFRHNFTGKMLAIFPGQIPGKCFGQNAGNVLAGFGFVMLAFDLICWLGF
jgi:hypothetical protein